MTIATHKPRLMHTMIRVFDLDRALEFYIGVLGMKELRRRDAMEGKYTNVFVGYGDEKECAVVEMTYNWDPEEPYELGSAFGHLALGVHDIYGTCETLKAAGVKIVREPGPVKFGTSVIAFIEDPDGRKIELIEEG